MSHSVIIVNNSLLEIFDPNDTEYAGVRDHFTTAELAQIDSFRARTHPLSYTLAERLFIDYVLAKAVHTADNET